MPDENPDKPLPDDHGQFGVNDATEEYRRLKDSPKPTPHPTSPDGSPAQSTAGSNRHV